MTGARVKRVEPYLGDDELFLCTYGDGLADVDIAALLDFHRSHGRLATVTGVHPPSRFGELVLDGTEVRRFAEKPAGAGLDLRRLLRLRPRGARPAVRRPLVRPRARAAGAAGRRRRAARLRHDGFWQCADTVRDVELLRGLWDGGTRRGGCGTIAAATLTRARRRTTSDRRAAIR